MNTTFKGSRRIYDMLHGGHSPMGDQIRDFDRVANIADGYYSESELEDGQTVDAAQDGIRTGIILVNKLRKHKNPKARIFEICTEDDDGEVVFYFVGTEDSICRKLKKIPELEQ